MGVITHFLDEDRTTWSVVITGNSTGFLRVYMMNVFLNTFH